MEYYESRMLKAAGLISFAIALLHIVIIFIGAPAYRYFGAGEEMACQAEAGLLIPAAVTLVIALVFTIFGLYAWSGAGVIRPLPLLAIGLVVISAIYTLRGLAVIGQLIAAAKATGDVEWRGIVFSLVSLITGVIYLLGTLAAWKRIKARAAKAV